MLTNSLMTLHFTIMGRHQAVRKISIVSQRREAEGFKIKQQARIIKKLAEDNEALKKEIEELKQKLLKVQYENEMLYIKEARRQDEDEDAEFQEEDF